jgi:CheY-like chemotaxis protein
MDGLEATRRILQRFPEGRRPRVVAMTANALAGDRDMCLAAGMDGYLAKPVELRYLRAVLESMGGPAPGVVYAATQRAEADLDRSKIAALRELQEPSAPDLVGSLVDLFCADAPGLIAAMEAAMQDGDARRVERAAHRFLSSLTNLGLTRMSGLCIEIERMGRTGRLEGVQQLMAELKEAYERALPALLAEKGTPPPQQ